MISTHRIRRFLLGFTFGTAFVVTFLLPSSVAVHWNSAGTATSYMSKYLAALLSLGLTSQELSARIRKGGCSDA